MLGPAIANGRGSDSDCSIITVVATPSPSACPSAALDKSRGKWGLHLLLTNVHNEQVNNATAATDRETEAMNVREGDRARERK